MLEETVRGSFVPSFLVVQIVQDPLPVRFQGTTTKMQGHMRKAALIIGKGTSALAGQFDRTLQLLVIDGEIRDHFTGPFDQGTTFFS